MRGPYLLELKESEELLMMYEKIGCDPGGSRIMLSKAKIYPLLIKDLKSPAANILKQHMLSLGGEAVVPRWVINNSQTTADVLLLGTIKEYGLLTEKLRQQPWGLPDLSQKISDLVRNLSKSKGLLWEWADGKKLELGRGTKVMGILNITPDSFSDGGQYFTPQKALERAQAMVAEGADVIDVGGESTRPNSQPITAEEELERLKPVLELLVKELPVPVSLDTYKAEVAAAGLELGVHIINDVGGGMRDPKMAEVVGKYQCPVIAMHNPVANSGDLYPYTDVVADVVDSLLASQNAFKQAGLEESKICLDPGIGFGKTVEQNLSLIKHIRALQNLGSPVLLAVSRKGFIGRVLDTEVTDRLEGSLAVAVWATTQGVDLLRVHDVQQTVRTIKMTEAILER
ncbi:MAG: dihydropteroate synthase [Peptococcia bacterium]